MSVAEIKKSAQRHLRRIQANKVEKDPPHDIYECIERYSPKLDRPDHLAPYVDKLHEAIRVGNVECVVHAAPQHGKGLANYVEILTKRGWTTVGDVKVGDYLVGSDGRWTQVTAVYPQPEQDLYRVTFGDGESIITDGPHRWATQAKHSRGWVIRTTGEMFGNERIDGTSKFNGKTYPGTRSRWAIPIVKPVEMSDTRLPLDPYLLGCWLGDCSTGAGQITSMDEEILQAFDAHFEAGATSMSGGKKAISQNYLGLRTALREIGVLGNKHVPEEYRTASIQQRLALVQGLCDTDGTVSRNGSQQDYCTTLPALRDAFVELIFSLGGHASVGKAERKCSVTTNPDGTKTRTPGKPSWRINFRLPPELGPAFRLSRKAERLRPPSGRNTPRRRIAKIEHAGRGPGTCFTVDAPDHLFCAGRSFILSHNTEIAKHAFIYAGIERPGLRHIYSTYNHFRALSIRNQIMRLAHEAGLDPHSRDAELEFSGGTIIQFVGTGGSLTGFPCDGLHLCDDPIKDRAEASSKVKRQAKWDWWQDVAQTRRHVGSSAVMMHTRWHEDDPAGRLIKDGWEYLRLPAICDDEANDPLGRKLGEALWPAMRPLEFLEQFRRNIITWSSLYQGHPRPVGDTLFQGVYYYDQLPVNGYANVYGSDLAYTAKTSADWSVLVCGRVFEDNIYITNVIRKQLGQDKFMHVIRPVINSASGPCLWFGSTTERGVAQLMRESIPTFMFAQATADKYVRALPTAEQLWNKGRILLPSSEEGKAPLWVDPFVNEVVTFTGQGDEHDDQVDALAAMGAIVLKGLAFKGQNINDQLKQRFKLGLRGGSVFRR